jgi:predicted  nucleic acid-binding Zn-ribbon protein
MGLETNGTVYAVLLAAFSLLTNVFQWWRGRKKSARQDTIEDLGLLDRLYIEVEKVYEKMLPIKREMEQYRLLSMELQSKAKRWQEKTEEAEQKYAEMSSRWEEAMREIQTLRDLLDRHGIEYP